MVAIHVLSPLLSEVLDGYKRSRSHERIPTPEPGRRGDVTAADVLRRADDGAHAEAVRTWAEAAYGSVGHGARIVRPIARRFLQRHGALS